MGRKKYRIVGLPEQLYLQCEQLVKSGEHGYVSVSEIVKDSVRRRLEELHVYLAAQKHHEKEVETHH